MASIQDIRSSGTPPQRAYEYEVEILGNVTTGNVPLLTQRVQSASIPETSVETIEINYKGRKALYAGRDASGHTATVTFWDDEAHTVYTFFKDWMENGISNSITGGGVARDLYSVEMVIKQFAHDSTTLTGQHRLTAVFPTTIGDIQMSYDSSEHMTVEVTFSFDSNLYEAA